MLDVDQVIRIQLEVMTGAPHTVPGAEAERLYDTLEIEIADMKARGITVALPNEFPGPNEVPAPPAPVKKRRPKKA